MALKAVGHRLLVRPTTSERLRLKLRPGRPRNLVRETAPGVGKPELRQGNVVSLSTDPEFKTNLKEGDTVYFRDSEWHERVPEGDNGSELLVLSEYDIVVKEG